MVKVTVTDILDLVKEIDSEDPIDWGMLSVDENMATEIIATGLLEQYNTTWADMDPDDRTVIMLATITKLVHYNMLLNANYQNMVNNALIREGKEADFKSKENWFTHVNDSFNGSIVAKKSDLTCEYLKFACNNAVTEKYYVNGVEATETDVQTIKQFRQKSSKAVNQGLDKDVVARTIKIEGIKSIKCGEKLIFG